MDTKLATMALRGLTLPEPTRKEIRKTGIYCRATIQLVYQQQSRRWALRGEEAGGAVASIGHYVGFTGADGQPLPCTQRIQNFMPNGVHVVIITPELCRLEMFRYENTYDVLITRHTLSPHQDTRPQIESKIVFFRRAGTLTTELWGKDSAFRGGARPRFFKKNGEEELPPATVLDALLKVTEAVCCVGCKHSHLLEMGARPCYLKQSFSEVGV
ncbi:hypothetical protein EDE15_0160 [Edaphobacter aggregans]|uniref:Uncharacterized protein n=1 Tax=Edaphobacter aggregans TaxID=570835 RepID=A0A428MCT0_9BACT|nr:hypothetical protein [Edaphobacter aggregans]RSL14698.1 hypothetical protein EDE15_0160 [Edaphobacter aggregans]